MYQIEKKFKLEVSHSYDPNSMWRNFHIHEITVTIQMKCDVLDEEGRVVDIEDIRKRLFSKYDHKRLNDIFNRQCESTFENMARWIALDMPSNGVRNLYCSKVEIEESKFLDTDRREIPGSNSSEVKYIFKTKSLQDLDSIRRNN